MSVISEGDTEDPNNIFYDHYRGLLVSGYCRTELCAQIGLQFVPEDVCKLIFLFLHSISFDRIAATGQRFTKYTVYTGTRKRKPQDRIVKVSCDDEYRPKRISCGRGSRHIDFTDILYIAWGHWTPVFEARKDHLEKELCFSVVGKQQVLDVQAQNKETAELWVKGLRGLIGMSDEESDRRVIQGYEYLVGQSTYSPNRLVAKQIGDTLNPKINDIFCGLLVSGYCRTELGAHIGLEFVPEDVCRLIFQWLHCITIPVMCQCSDGRYFLIVTDGTESEIKSKASTSEQFMKSLEELKTGRRKREDYSNVTIAVFMKCIGNILRNDLGVDECNLHSNELGQIHVHWEGSEKRDKSESSKMEERREINQKDTRRMMWTQFPEMFDPHLYLNDEPVLLEQLNNFSEIAEKGQLFTKYTESKVSKPTECMLKVSFDGKDRPKQISWVGGPKSIDFADILCIFWGYHWTPAFEGRRKELEKKLCFSVIGRERSLDIEAHSKEIAELWVRGLRRLLTQYGQVSDRGNLCADREENKRQRIRSRLFLRNLGDSFGRTTTTVFRNLEEDGVWIIDQSVRQRFTDQSMYEQALREDISWREWYRWVRNQIVSYLVDNNRYGAPTPAPKPAPNPAVLQYQRTDPPLPQCPYQPVDIPSQVPMNADLIATALNGQLQDGDGANNPNDAEQVECKTQ